MLHGAQHKLNHSKLGSKAQSAGIRILLRFRIELWGGLNIMKLSAFTDEFGSAAKQAGTRARMVSVQSEGREGEAGARDSGATGFSNSFAIHPESGMIQGTSIGSVRSPRRTPTISHGSVTHERKACMYIS